MQGRRERREEEKGKRERRGGRKEEKKGGRRDPLNRLSIVLTPRLSKLRLRVAGAYPKPPAKDWERERRRPIGRVRTS